MHVRTETLCVLLELFEIVGQPGHGVCFNFLGQCAERLPFGQAAGCIVAFAVYEPQRPVVPVGSLVVGDKRCCQFGVRHRLFLEKRCH